MKKIKSEAEAIKITYESDASCRIEMSLSSTMRMMSIRLGLTFLFIFYYGQSLLNVQSYLGSRDPTYIDIYSQEVSKNPKVKSSKVAKKQCAYI